MATKRKAVITEPPETRFQTVEEFVSRPGALSNIHQRLGGLRGSFVTSVLYGPENMRRISLLGWSGDSREKRLAKHRRSIVKARAVLKEIRVAKKKHGNNWQYEQFRERILASPDPKAALRKILDGH